MIKWFKRSQPVPVQTTESENPTPVKRMGDLEEESSGFYSRLKRGLLKTRKQLGEGIAQLLLGKKTIDAELFEELEILMLRADIGIDTTRCILKQLEQKLSRNKLDNGEAVYHELKIQLQNILLKNSFKELPKSEEGPFVILMIGINGAGKTTTIGKLAKQFKAEGKKVMLAAADTFRAAAIDQLKVWGERNEIPVIAQQQGSDSASVAYDAYQAAKARKVDVLIIDTAGRLHTQHSLMQELQKVKRVLQKLDSRAPQETMLVLDGSIGQNALNQARQFHEAIDVTSITMTKLDGTAKGGVLFAIANELTLPFGYIGVGESVDDLRPFNASEFVDAIFTENFPTQGPTE